MNVVIIQTERKTGIRRTYIVPCSELSNKAMKEIKERNLKLGILTEYKFVE